MANVMAIAYQSDLGERTFRFACDIVRFCQKLAAEPGVARQIAWQLADAGTSVAANYEEAQGSYSPLRRCGEKRSCSWQRPCAGGCRFQRAGFLVLTFSFYVLTFMESQL
jgi:hypothetical protein